MTGEGSVGSQVAVVDMTEAMRAFIYSSWLLSYRHGIAKDYYAGQRLLIGHILKTAMVRVATAKLDVDLIHGWICYGATGVLHYVYVKEKFRNFGIAKLLADELGPAPIRSSHMTAAGDAWLRRLRPGNVAYNEYLAYFPELA